MSKFAVFTSACVALTAIFFVAFHRDANSPSADSIQALQTQVDALKRHLSSLAPHGGDNEENVRQLSAITPFTYASDFGAVGDSTTDDTIALQAAIDSAEQSLTGGTVVLSAGTFYITAPLILPGGVTLQGQGYGSSPLAVQFDSGASTIAYCGPDYAVRITGHAASIRNVAIYDWIYPAGSACATMQAAGGVLIEADSQLIESVTMSNVLLYFFLGGTALTLRGQNEGGIAYSSFSNVRIRHAKTGIHLMAEVGSFVNSNQFYGGAISGTIDEAGVHAQGDGACNDNKFYGMVIEPPETSMAHVYVEGPITNVVMHDLRLEGTDMVTQKRPLVIIEDDSYNNVMNGLLGHTHVQADLLRNPGIDFVSTKTVGIDPPPLNMFANAAFHGFDGSNFLPGWNTPGTNTAIGVMGDELFANHQVLEIDHLYGGAFILSPKSLPKSPIHSQCTFGIYARSSVQGSIVATMRNENGAMISSNEHTGSGKWEFIAMSALFDSNTNDAKPQFHITGEVQITAPTFVYGRTPATPGASLMSSSGAKMDGTLAMSMVTATPPASGNFWVLRKNEGNLFRMDMMGNPSQTIIRINDQGPDRFMRGTVITLLFSEVGTALKHSAYIGLLGGQDFVVSKPNSSITLVANGDPTWTEVSRNA